MPNEETTERSVEIVPFGTDERIKLNVGMIQKMIAVPTKSGHIADAVACMKFMMLCKARHLNPWEGDAFLIGYDTQDGPQFSLITAHQVFLKRAEASEGFDGMQSGVVVEREESELGQIIEREGDLIYEGEKLIGGWAKVYRKDRQMPFYKRLKLSTFNTGRSRWAKDAAGMIVKCAEADALRTAFPTHLGGLYMREELEPIDITPKPAGNGITFGPAIPEETREATIAALEDLSGGKHERDEQSTSMDHAGDPVTVAQEPTPKKRHRRTKAQIEADNAAKNLPVPVLADAEKAQHKAVDDGEARESTKSEPFDSAQSGDIDKDSRGGQNLPPLQSAEQRAAAAGWSEDLNKPARATPLEGLRNLIAATPITEFQLENYCRRKGMLEAHQNLANLTEHNMGSVIDHFHSIANGIADGTDV